MTALFALAAAATPAAADAAREPAAHASGEDAARDDARAVISVVAFDGEGRPAALVVHADGGTGRVTDLDGRAVLDVDAGAHLLVVEAPETPEVRGGCRAQVRVRVGPGQVADVIATVRSGPAGCGVTIDAPGADPADAPQSDNRASVVGSSQTRSVVLTVVNALDGAALPEVRCYLQGGGALGVTDGAGHLSAALPAGPASLSFIHPRSAPRVVEVPASAAALRVELVPAASELDELVVHAPYIEGALAASVDVKREEHQVVEVIGSDQMRRSGDADAAAALKRATGLTVVGGKYVYVRGLGERYSSTLLDGATLPSPEPERRVVPLDMFPAGALSSVVVQKTWSPDLPGDFGGGAVLLQSRRIPEKPYFDIHGSLAGTLGTTLAPGPRAQGGGLDFLGVDDGARAMPAGLVAASARGPLAEKSTLVPGGYAPAELERLGESLPRTWDTTREAVPPSASLGVGFGDRFDLFGARLGVIGSASWAQDWTRSDEEHHKYAVGTGGALAPLEDATVEGVDRNVRLGGLLGTGLEAAGLALQCTTFLQRVTDDDARLLSGFDRDVGADVRATRIDWTERTLFSERLSGEHDLPWLSSTLSWRYAYAVALRDEPDQRETRYDRDPNSGALLLSDRPEGNQRLYSTLMDQSHDAELSWKVPLLEDGDVKTGIGLTTKSRSADTRRFKFLFKGESVGTADVRKRDADEVFTPDNIGPGGFVLSESTRKTDNYEGLSLIGSTYALADVPLPFDLMLSAGARVEASHIGVKTFELFNADATPALANLDSVDVLPSAGLTWEFADDMQLRVAGALTVSRPELRELSPAVFTDVTAGRSRHGNADLVSASIAHLDARFEWYPSPTETLSVALFAKRFQNPIEEVITPGSDQAVTWDNADSAVNAGAELEARAGLGRVTPLLDAFFVGGNAALIWSQVQLPDGGVQTSTTRPLAGQSPWVLNAQAGWQRDGSSVTVLYNVFGARIRDVGVLGAPDVYEQPFHELDVVVVQDLPWNLSLSAKAANLLAGETLLTQGDKVLERSGEGPSLSVSVGLKLD